MDAKEKVSAGFTVTCLLRSFAFYKSEKCFFIALEAYPVSVTDDVFLQHVLLGLRFSELSWDHSDPEEEGDSHILWLEFDGEEDGTPVNKLLKIYSKQVR